MYLRFGHTRISNPIFVFQLLFVYQHVLGDGGGACWICVFSAAGPLLLEPLIGISEQCQNN